MKTHIQILEDNDWICDCVGPWCFLLLLATKPHQEGCKDIKEFIRRLCISYLPLKSATRSFEFTIPHLIDNIEDFGGSNGPL